LGPHQIVALAIQFAYLSNSPAKQQRNLQNEEQITCGNVQ
jgi:hypothetical protein